MNPSADYYRNKNKHTSHIIRIGDAFDFPDAKDVELSPEKRLSPKRDMSPQEKKEYIVNTKLHYLPANIRETGLHIQGHYELALKRRHGAKKMF